MEKSKKIPGELAALRLVTEGAASETGEEFFRALVHNLAVALGTLGAWVTEYFPDKQRLRALGMWLGDDFVDDYEYDLAGTACEKVIQSKGLIHIPERLIELFPLDTDLVPIGAVSYLGMPLLDTDGTVLGHISVLDDKPMPRDERAVSLFEIFGARAAAEHRRLKAETEIRLREEQLSVLLTTALDAIILIDDQFTIANANPAAERLFGGARSAMIGSPFLDFLIDESAARLAAFVHELESLPCHEQKLWIPQDIIGRRRDGSVFPAEITLSRFEVRQGAFFTLILRNADERIEAEKRIQLLTRETEYLREAVGELPGQEDLIGRSDPMKVVLDAIQSVARTDSTVLITGETGTGKELVARSIHRQSERAKRPLILLNCAAMPANLIESEFFGHERGAFTGATTKREGRFALADGGTIFLDEVGELPFELQAKLLRVLQEGEFEPLGGARTVKVDVRVIAATNRDLNIMTRRNEFREDLYYRLNVFPIHLPPLRDRGRDVEHLANCFVERLAKRMGKSVQPLSESQLECLRNHDWPGNVRELQNVIERSLILSTGQRSEIEQAMTGIVGPSRRSSDGSKSDPENRGRVLTVAEMETFERANLLRALESAGWKVSGMCGAARLLGIPPTTLTSRMKALGLKRPAG